MSLSGKQAAFVAEYLRDFNATQAAIRAGYSPKTAYAIGQENLKKPEIAQAIAALVEEKSMGNDEILVTLTEQARSDMGVFYKLVEEWTYYPLPSYDIIDAKEVQILDTDGQPTGEKKISYWVRHVVVDMEKLLDPRYSRSVKKFTDSPKNGLGIELYDKQGAVNSIAKLRGMVIDKHEVKAEIDLAPALDKALKKIYGDHSDSGT